MMKVGITGHQRLDDPDAWGWVESVIERWLDEVAAPITAVTSLATGADQIFAALIARRGGRIYAVIPFAGYERTFDGVHVDGYREMLARAACVEVLQANGTDEDAYLAAGQRVVELADLMIAVWNGQPAKGRGGTADVVAFAQEQGVPLMHINPVDRTMSRRP